MRWVGFSLPGCSCQRSLQKASARSTKTKTCRCPAWFVDRCALTASVAACARQLLWCPMGILGRRFHRRAQATLFSFAARVHLPFSGLSAAGLATLPTAYDAEGQSTGIPTIKSDEGAGSGVPEATCGIHPHPGERRSTSLTNELSQVLSASCYR
ncbi:hypothetical protein GY45DRAFT_951358 [Cubamyces sp. BRFM 1775]|nr:hypothetical protein GY45DRAFT_951358 [Cubamyces sp. BRFM 1775]